MSVGQPRSFGNRFLTSDERVSNWIDLCRGELDSVLFFFSFPPTYEYFRVFAAKSYATSISLMSIPSSFDPSISSRNERSIS